MTLFDVAIIAAPLLDFCFYDVITEFRACNMDHVIAPLGGE